MQTVRPLLPAIVLAAMCAGFEEKGFEYFIPYVPTPQPIVERMLELADVGADDFLIDLGSGDGRIAITAAKKHGARAFGVDIEPRLVRLANENAAKAGVAHKVSFREQNLFDTRIADATVIALYLPPSINLKLRPRLLSELKPGTRIVSHAFHMGGWLADTRESVRGIEIYLWVVPARVAGTWQIKDGGRQFALTLEQKFQEIHGTASIDDHTVPLHDVRLRGDAIAFSVDVAGQRIAYRGTVDGGEIRSREADRPWSARRTPER